MTFQRPRLPQPTDNSFLGRKKNTIQLLPQPIDNTFLGRQSCSQPVLAQLPHPTDKSEGTPGRLGRDLGRDPRDLGLNQVVLSKVSTQACLHLLLLLLLLEDRWRVKASLSLSRSLSLARSLALVSGSLISYYTAAVLALLSSVLCGNR